MSPTFEKSFKYLLVLSIHFDSILVENKTPAMNTTVTKNI